MSAAAPEFVPGLPISSPWLWWKPTGAQLLADLSVAIVVLVRLATGGVRMPGCAAACVCSVLGAQGPSLGTRRACALGPTHCVLPECVLGLRARACCVCCSVCCAPADAHSGGDSVIVWVSVHSPALCGSAAA